MTSSRPTATVPASLRRGAFIVLEGGDGSGKSTQLRLLAERLRAAGRDVVVTREPGGTGVGERLRELVLDPAHAPIDPVTEALLFAAARSAHVRQAIEPALEAGRTVVSDRYVDSSAAYQGAGRRLGLETVARLNDWATGGLTPDLTVVLDVDPDTAVSRRRARNRSSGAAGPDRMESEPADFHTRIRQAFLARAAQAPQRYLVLDAARPVQELAAAIAGRALALAPESREVDA